MSITRDSRGFSRSGMRLFQPMLSHRFMSFWLHAAGNGLGFVDCWQPAFCLPQRYSCLLGSDALRSRLSYLCVSAAACMCVRVWTNPFLINACDPPSHPFHLLRSRWGKFKWYLSNYLIYWYSAMASISHSWSRCKCRGAGEKCMSTAIMICPLFIL